MCSMYVCMHVKGISPRPTAPNIYIPSKRYNFAMSSYYDAANAANAAMSDEWKSFVRLLGLDGNLPFPPPRDGFVIVAR